MNKKSFSLNFMRCMERFATQIYQTQQSFFKSDTFKKQLVEASENERTHVQKLQAQIKKLKYSIYPFGFLFQTVGFFLGIITFIAGKRNLFKANIFVEKRAVKDYNGFLKSITFDTETIKLLQGIIAEEVVHISNWKNAAASLEKS